MKTSRVLLVLLVLGGLVCAQEPVPVATAAPDNPVPAALPRRSAQELEQLLGPIALYPDALIAIILPASTASTDIVLAARYVRDFPNDKSQIENRAWDESVKSLANYPEVLKWMDENLQWTKQVGEAFAIQPAEVMQAVQRLRARARAAGALIDTPQQQVIADQQAIRIVPAQPDVIYVPHYEPDVVFVDRPIYVSQPFLTFGFGVPVGSWLAFECDWGRSTIWVGNRHRRWTGHDWRRPVVPIAPVSVAYAHAPDVRQWRPPPQARAPFSVAWSPPAPVVRPVPIGSTFPRTFPPRAVPAEPRRETGTLPVVRTLPRANPTAPPTNTVNSFPGTTVVRAPVPTTAPASATTPVPTNVVTAAPRRNPDWVREREGRGQGYPAYRNPPAYVATVPTAPALPMTTPVAPAPAMGPVATPGYSYSHQHAYAPPSNGVPAASYGYSAPAATYSGPRHAVNAPAPAPTPQATQPAQSAPSDRDRTGGDHQRRRENVN